MVNYRSKARNCVLGLAEIPVNKWILAGKCLHCMIATLSTTGKRELES